MGHAPDFETWWICYPRKVAKGTARKAYDKALSKVSPDSLLRATERFNFGTEERFIPHPATWLNAERWIEAQDEAPSGASMSEAERRMMFWTKNSYWNSDWGPRPDVKTYGVEDRRQGA